MVTAAACRPGAVPAAPVAKAPVVATVPPDGVYYCSEVSSVFAKWECAGEVTAELAKRRHRVVKVTVTGGRRLSEHIVNGHGAPWPGSASTCVYTHDAAGRVVGETVFDGYGVERVRWTYAPDGTRAEQRNVWGELARTGEDDVNWVVALHERDAQGRRLRTRYQDGSGAPRTVGGDTVEVRFGGFGEDTSFYTENARFDGQGRPAGDAGGAHRTVFKRGQWGYMAARFFSPDGGAARIDGRWGWDRHFDAIGNTLRLDNVDANGDVVNAEDEAGRTIWVYDEHGDAVEVRKFGPHGAPYHGAGASITRRVFDDRGRDVVIAHFDAAGTPTTELVYARAEMTYDAAGALSQKRIFRADGRPGHLTLGDKLAEYDFRYDDRHNLIEIRRYAADGSRGVDRDGVWSTRIAYHHDQIIGSDTRGIDGDPIAVKGVARTKTQRDATGMRIGRTCEDATGKIVKAYDYQSYRIPHDSVTGTPAVKRTREEALQRANGLVAMARKTGNFTAAGATYADEPSPYRATAEAPEALWPQLTEALERTPVGGVTDVVDTPAGFIVVKRTL